ncbi:MAG: hypothetical protein LBB38_01940 [Puniceicoccales bacterium]|jgi:hypothetical protein|nr:hypothetical protein [Puniceicoccales bacterium]
MSASVFGLALRLTTYEGAIGDNFPMPEYPDVSLFHMSNPVAPREIVRVATTAFVAGERTRKIVVFPSDPSSFPEGTDPTGVIAGKFTEIVGADKGVPVIGGKELSDLVFVEYGIGAAKVMSFHFNMPIGDSLPKKIVASNTIHVLYSGIGWRKVIRHSAYATY